MHNLHNIYTKITTLLRLLLMKDCRTSFLIVECMHWYMFLSSCVPVSQSVPSYPASHVQLNSFKKSLHAPFWQGKESHSLISRYRCNNFKLCKLNINWYHFSLEFTSKKVKGCMEPKIFLSCPSHVTRCFHWMQCSFQ